MPQSIRLHTKINTLFAMAIDQNVYMVECTAPIAINKIFSPVVVLFYATLYNLWKKVGNLISSVISVTLFLFDLFRKHKFTTTTIYYLIFGSKTLGWKLVESGRSMSRNCLVSLAMLKTFHKNAKAIPLLSSPALSFRIRCKFELYL